jgi:hypothetical protein
VGEEIARVRSLVGAEKLTSIRRTHPKPGISLQGTAAKVILAIKDAATDDALEHFVFDVTWLAALGDGVARSDAYAASAILTSN